jgi:hypothetical protein
MQSRCLIDSAILLAPPFLVSGFVAFGGSLWFGFMFAQNDTLTMAKQEFRIARIKDDAKRL